MFLLLHDFAELKLFCLGNWAALYNLYNVALFAEVFWIMNSKVLGPSNQLLDSRVLHKSANL